MKNMKIYKFSLLLFVLCFQLLEAKAQQSVVTINEFKKKVSYNFSNEWQYLSTDLYLINANKFDDLLNDLSGNGKKKRKKDAEIIEYLLMTASIKGLKFGGDLTYPIYNFQVKTNADNRYNTTLNNAPEVIRIIDNLPLAATNDYIDAEIKVDAITNKTGDKVYNIVASQLKNISTLMNPSAAVMSLVGEFGKFMESKTQNKEYSFRSTIRIYEEQDFNKRLFSINIYVFAPSTVEKAGMDTIKLSNYLKSLDNPTIDRRTLVDLIDYRNYPFLVLANYKSRYITEPIIGDEITFESIEKRRQKMQSAYESSLINKETYLQEVKLNEFLETFSQLKLEINNYALNYKNKITEDFSKSFFVILQNYRKLKNTYKNRLQEFARNASFNNEFKAKYESILLNSELYLENDNNLRNIKEMVNTIYNFENETHIELDSAKRENYIRKLYSVELPESEKNSEETKIISDLISRLEDEQFTKVYKRHIDKLLAVAANDNSISLSEDLKTRIKSTNCKTCRIKANDAITLFSTRYDAYKLSKAVQENDEITKNAKDQLFYIVKKESCIAKQLKDNYADGMPDYVQLIETDFQELVKVRISLQATLTVPIPNDNLDKMLEWNEQINATLKKLTDGQNSLCNKIKSICDCKE